MNEDVVDSFAAIFSGPPGDRQRERRKARARAERRTQLTDKQRKRNAVRTTQINFRCSPAFRELVAEMTQRLDCSIADVMEQALEMLASAQGQQGLQE